MTKQSNNQHKTILYVEGIADRTESHFYLMHIRVKSNFNYSLILSSSPYQISLIEVNSNRCLPKSKKT